MTLSDGFWGEEEGVGVSGLEDSISASVVDSVLVFGRHAEKNRKFIFKINLICDIKFNKLQFKLWQSL